MTSAISGTQSSHSASAVSSAAPVAAPQQVKIKTDSDGENVASKVAPVEKPKATSGTVGTIINTSA